MTSLASALVPRLGWDSPGWDSPGWAPTEEGGGDAGQGVTVRARRQSVKAFLDTLLSKVPDVCQEKNVKMSTVRAVRVCLATSGW